MNYDTTVTALTKTQEEMITAAVLLKKKIPARIDLHTSLFSGSIRDTFIVIPTMSLSTVYRSTGQVMLGTRQTYLQISLGLQTTNDCCSQTCSLGPIFLTRRGSFND